MTVAILRVLGFLAATTTLIQKVIAHQIPVLAPEDADNWGVKHMIGTETEEHHIGNFDPLSFFVLHDFDSSGFWDAAEIARTYGLDDPTSKDLPTSKRLEVVQAILGIFAPEGGDSVSAKQFEEAYRRGKRLPDLGVGPGHHGDAEYEYEIHHFEKFHDANSNPEDLIHPEDIEHFKMHDMLDEAEDKNAELAKMPIVEANIPSKFRKQN